MRTPSKGFVADAHRGGATRLQNHVKKRSAITVKKLRKQSDGKDTCKVVLRMRHCWMKRKCRRMFLARRNFDAQCQRQEDIVNQQKKDNYVICRNARQ